MSDKKISQLDAVTVALNADELAIVNAGITKKISIANFKKVALQIVDQNFVTVPTTQTLALSTTTSTNTLDITNPGLTVTITFPPAPVDGQVCGFAILTNTATLASSGGVFKPVFTAARGPGFVVRYVYNTAQNIWYLTT